MPTVAAVAATATSVPTVAATATSVPTVAATATSAPTVAATATSAATATAAATATSAATATAAATATSAATATAAATATSAATATAAATATSAATALPTAAPTTPAAATLPNLGTIEIAYVPVLAFTPFFVAADKGFFAEQGLQVRLQRVRNSDEMIAPLSTGRIDATSLNVSTGFFNAMFQRFDIRAVGGAGGWQAPNNSASTLVVSKRLIDSGEVRSLVDLKGRKVAINLRGSSPEFVLARALEQVGLTLDDVIVVQIPVQDIPVAINNGAVDAAIVATSNATTMINNGVATKLLADVDVLPSGQGTVITFGQRMLKADNREVAVRLMAAYLKATRYLLSTGWNSPEIVSIIQKYTDLQPQVIRATSKPELAIDGEIEKANVLDAQAFQISRGYVLYKEPLSIDQMTEMSFLNEAQQRLKR